MNTIQTKYVTVSLPRTGTMSMTQMMKHLGFSVKHVPGPDWIQFMERVDFVSDTPVFIPSNIVNMKDKFTSIKFIYITKTAEKWADSMIKVGLNNAYENMKKQIENGETLNRHSQTDFDALNELMNGKEFTYENAVNAFNNHFEKIQEIISPSDLLIYSFSDGWEPLAEFTNTTPPSNIELPHLNQNTMFDKIV